ncbi:MAG TPA: SRPBCC family protein [Gaiellaceae bacterium]|nr:SRPBCC family protein [Gaiellaceae bacterium]
MATAEAEINAPRSKVWLALTDPDQIQKYMFGSRVETDWKPGSRITWTGEYEGKKYEDKGEILEVEKDRRLKVTHFSPLSGEKDAPENYHTLVYELKDDDGKTHVSLSQDNNPTEEAAEHSQANWEKVLSGLKELVEGKS